MSELRAPLEDLLALLRKGEYTLDTDELEFDSLDEPTESNESRFTDGDFQVISWDADMALRLTGANKLPTRAAQVERLQDWINEGDLPDEAVDRLIDAGWTELL